MFVAPLIIGYLLESGNCNGDDNDTRSIASEIIVSGGLESF